MDDAKKKKKDLSKLRPTVNGKTGKNVCKMYT